MQYATIEVMACGSCAKRKRVAGEPGPVAAGPGTKMVFHAVSPAGVATPYRTLFEARAAARKGGGGWTIDGRRLKVD